MPVKYEHVVFCRLSEFQLSLYELFMTSPEIKRLLRGIGSQPLKGTYSLNIYLDANYYTHILT